MVNDEDARISGRAENRLETRARGAHPLDTDTIIFENFGTESRRQS